MSTSTQAFTLLLDTSSDIYLGLLNQEFQCVSSLINTENQQSERLSDLTAELLAKADASFGQISRIVIATGPGSFTGVRVGIAFAQGLAMPRSLPIYPVTSLEAMLVSATASGATLCGAVIPAKRGHYYFSANIPAPQIPKTQSMLAEVGLLALADLVPNIITTRAEPVLEAAFNKVILLKDIYAYTHIAQTAVISQPVTNGIVKPNYILLPAAEAKRTGKQTT
jgi:tRNA threonylcarbamoyladenosine biosynthesis protein TsaB